MDEFAAIARYFRSLTEGQPEALNLLDDAALLTPPDGKELIVTTDALQEGIHFIGDEPPAQLAQKSLRVNLSDLAAKGATPYCYFMTLALSPRCGVNWLAGFTEGLQQDQQRFGIFLAGGDTTRSKTQLAITITAIGMVEKGSMVKRSGAQVGDGLYVTGHIGDAALGLLVKQGDDSFPAEVAALLKQRYCLPEPRVAWGKNLSSIATSALDVSDGLVQDARKLCAASALSCDIALQHTPLSAAGKSWVEKRSDWETLLAGGDDYELLFTAPEERHPHVISLAETLGVPVTRLGTLKIGKGVRFLDDAGKLLSFAREGWSHRIG